MDFVRASLEKKGGDTVGTKKITRLALLTAIALTIFLVEAQIPALVPIPGIKLGLANIVTVFTVYALGSKDGCLVLAARIFLGAVFAGNFSTILYSAAGGALAILVLVTATPGLLLYLPVMIGVSILTGCFTGLCAQFLVNRGKLWKTISE